MSPQQKILYIITKSAWGGAQRYVFDLATRLDTGRFDILVACGPSTGSGQAGPLIEKLQDAGIRTVLLPALGRDPNPWVDARAFVALIRTFSRERPDVIHLSSSKAGGIGAIAAFIYKLTARAWRTRVIFTVHGWAFNEDRPWRQRASIFLASWLSILFQDRVIVITTADYRSGRRFVPKKKLALIFHGIESIDFLGRISAREFFSQRIGEPLDERTILIVSNAELTKNKGLTYLVSAMRLLREARPELNAKLILMSNGEDRGRIRRQIAEAGLARHVFLAGFVPDAKRYLKAFDLFVLPSVKEGLPYAIMEAMAAGLPIVATRVGGLPDLIRDGESGLLVAPKNPAELAEAIGRLLQDRALGERLGRRAREALRHSFPLDAMLNRTTALYEAD